MRGFMRRSGSFWILGTTWLGLAALPLAARAQDLAACPDMLAADRLARQTPFEEPTGTDAPIDFEGLDPDNSAFTLNDDGTIHFEGGVRVRQGNRSIVAEQAEFNSENSHFRISGQVQFEDPVLRATSDGGGSYSATDGASLSNAEFELRQRPARGAARNMQMTPEGLIKLDGVSFTTCPRDDSSWRLRASSITLDTKTRIGTGRGTRVDFKDVPILYLPWMSFPLGSERKSGFLFPTLGHSTRSGAQFALPYYWNIAPNADLTFEPMLYSERGIDFGGEVRFLSERQRTTLHMNFLPDDNVEHRDRSRIVLQNVTNLPGDVRFFIDAANVSDSRYFEDFAQGPAGTSVAFVERLAGFRYRDENWRASAEFQQFQTIDQSLAEEDRPYARLPRILVSADYGWGPEERVRYGFDSEVVNFDRDFGVTGWRFDAMPTASLDLGGPGMFLRPGVAFRHTSYALEDTLPGQRKNPSRSLPIASVDAGLIFERDSGSRAQRRLTLEPRLLYLNVPFREQDDLPLFDTGLPDLNLVQLFRTNRYVGADRVSDADQVSLGATSRLYDAEDGTQFLSVTVGQTYYFKQPRVRLPDEPVRDSHTSDFIGQVSLTAYKNWNADFGIQWNPDQSRSERAQANVQFRPDGEQVINVGYRFQRDRLEQTELSGAWPVGEKWNVFARYVYSLRDDKALEQFGGLEYRSCCWRARLVGRKFVSSRTGEQDTGIYLQLELTGLASVGSAADAFLTGAIRGYERPEPLR
jgi:LPS-assembly protein